MSIAQIKLKLRFYGDPVLRRRARPVALVGEKELALLAGMEEMMRSSGGIGLAAPQVGVSKQVVLVDVGDGPVALFNPRIEKKSGADTMEEGCLSLPGVTVRVRRPKRVQVSAVNERNEKISLWASGLLARAIQHEMDHLRGRMIIDYANFLNKISLRKELKKRLEDVER